MLAKNVMVADVVTALADEKVEDVLHKMRSAKLRMLPVLDADRRVIGVVSTFSVMERVVPSYIVTGDLNQIPYAPDMGVLHRHFEEVRGLRADAVMDAKPLKVQADESLLSVAAAMISYKKHEYAMVIDDDGCLLGIISAGDVLDRLSRGDVIDA